MNEVTTKQPILTNDREGLREQIAERVAARRAAPPAKNQGDQRDDQIKKLKSAVLTMHSLSGIGFERIAAIARVALKSLETPGAWKNLEDIAEVLKLIEDTAFDVGNTMECEAESVGSLCADEDRDRRRAARLEAMKKEVSMSV